MINTGKIKIVYNNNVHSLNTDIQFLTVEYYFIQNKVDIVYVNFVVHYFPILGRCLLF